jgi:hypothetical protein
MLQSALASALGSIPLAGLIALLFRFPVPFAGIASGPKGMVPAMFGAFFYSLLGGVFVQAAAGGMAGVLAYVIGRRGAPRMNLLTVILGLAGALPGLLVLAVLDWIIGPW